MKLLFSHILELSCAGAVLLAFLTLPVRAEETAAAPEVVWVKADRTAFETQGVIGDGTEANPFNTIQKGVDTVAVGGTVKIMAGTYDYDEQFDGAHTNRVIINKRVILDGVDGKDATHIVGKLSNVDLANLKIGTGTDAIRCIKTAGSSVNQSIIRNLTLRDGGATGSSDGSGYGGAVSHSDSFSNPLYLVDCTISNCVAAWGGAINGAWAIRCKFDNCRSTSWGAVAKNSRLLHCLLTKIRRYGSSNFRPTIYRSYVINCTIMGGNHSYHSGIDNNSDTGFHGYVCNTISIYHKSANIAAGGEAYEINCYENTSSSFPFVDRSAGDFHLALEPGVAVPKAIGRGNPAHISKFFNGVSVTPPDGLALNVDLDGNEIDMTKDICDIGCYQCSTKYVELNLNESFGAPIVEGVTIGTNLVERGDAIVISPATGTRYCPGVVVNGVTNLFENGESISVSFADIPLDKSGITVSAIYSGDWYVDDDGDDKNTGYLPTCPKKTLAAAMRNVLSGDTVHAAAGTYDEGYMTASATKCYDGRSRVKIPSGVTLVADEGKEKTLIVGAPDTTQSGDEYQMGTNAVRCVYLSANSRVKDFTITGGYTWGKGDGTSSERSNNGSNWSGGGIYGDVSGIVDGCIVSNNWACYGGGMRTVTAVRSLIFENHAIEQGGAMRGAKLYGCIVDKNYTGFNGDKNPAACYNLTAIVGCTLGDKNYTNDGGDDGVAVTGEGTGSEFRYSLVLGSLGNQGNTRTIRSCIFATGVGNWNEKFDENCVSSAKNRINLDENYRPLPGSIGVDWVTAEQLSSATGGKLPLDKDIFGFQRVMNGKADVGALEADWRKEYAKRLAGNSRHIKVECAAPGVVTNDVAGVSSLSLHNGEVLEFV